MNTRITGNTVISHAILQKGDAARTLLNLALCGGASVCCYGTSLQLGHAAVMVDKADALPKLLADLNELPDTAAICHQLAAQPPALAATA